MSPHIRDQVIAELQHYRPSKQARELVSSTPILLLVGISGAGKDTVKDHLLSDKPDYHHIVSHTTRAPRSNNGVRERNGVEYHFIDRVKAQEMVKHREFIESNIYASNLYGTSTEDIHIAKLEGKVAISAIEVQGVEEYKKISPKVKAVFLLPPNYAVWQERYRNRYGGEFSGHSPDTKRRMQTALIELNLALTDNFFTFVVNEKLSDTIAVVDAIAHGKKVDHQARAKE